MGCDFVPKKPTESLGGVRFEFNQKERDMLETYTTTQSIRNILAGAGAILGPMATFASTPAGIAVFGALLATFFESKARQLERQLLENPDSLSNADLGYTWLWNATIGAPIDLVTDPIGGVSERVAVLRETSSRITGWLQDQGARVGNTSSGGA